MEMNEIEVGDYYLMKIQNGIMYITVKPDIFVELHMVKEVIAKQRDVLNGKPILVALDVSTQKYLLLVLIALTLNIYLE